jgi:hypothetical protein
MQNWIPLSKRSVAELRAQAAAYRRLADGARTDEVAASLRRIAARYDALADRRAAMAAPTATDGEAAGGE